MQTETIKGLSAAAIIRRTGNLIRKWGKDSAASIRYLPARRKIMLLSILLIEANFYSAIAGIWLLAGYTAYEWRAFQATPEGRMPFRQFIRRSYFFIPGSVLFLSAFAGATVSRHYFSAVIAVFLLVPILFCVTAIQFLWKREDALHFARYSVMMILPIAIYTLLSPWAASPLWGAFRNIRITGTFGNANFFAYALELLLVFALALFYHVWNPVVRREIIAAFAAGVVCLYFTSSRTGFIAFLIGLTVFLFCMSEKRLLSAVFAAIAILLALAAIFPEKSIAIIGDCLPRSFFDVQGFETRFEIWNIAVRRIKASPFIGTGLFTFNLYIPINAPAAIKRAVHAHNIFLNFWMETGLTGVMSLIWMIARAGITAARRLSASPMRPYLAAGIGIIAVTVVHGIMDAPLISSQTITLFALFLGSVCITREEAAISPPSRVRI